MSNPNNLTPHVTEEAIRALRCACCDAPATCVGSYDEPYPGSPACDECCGHGCEDGHCESLFDEAGDVDPQCRKRVADFLLRPAALLWLEGTYALRPTRLN